MNSNTQTQTYTIADIRRVFASFAAEFAMIGQATGLHTRASVAQTVADLTCFAGAGHLVAVDVILRDAAGKKIRAAKYIVSTSTAGWSNDSPGNNLWPRTPGGQLTVIATLNADWWSLTGSEQAAVRQTWGISDTWSRTTDDISHAGMTATTDRQFVSNGYGVTKTVYQ